MTQHPKDPLRSATTRAGIARAHERTRTKRPPLPPRRWRAHHFVWALNEAGGLLTEAARLLGCDRSTVQRAVQRWPEVRQALEDARERLLDQAESVVRRSIEAGDVETARWVLSRQGRSRGWGERLELAAEGEPVPLRILPPQLAAPREEARQDVVDGEAREVP